MGFHCRKVRWYFSAAPVKPIDVRRFLNALSILYVGVYVGEAVSAQIATAFIKTGTPWNSALKAIGIVGIVVGVLLLLVLREPPRRQAVVVSEVDNGGEIPYQPLLTRLGLAKAQLATSFSHIIRLRSFWLLCLSSGARQFSGNVFGYYMPSYLASLYPTQPNILSNYGIIVGVVGSVAVLLGGLMCSYWFRGTLVMPLYITGIGGIVSSVFVILMVLSRDIAGGDQDKGTRILYGVMCAAYLTAELWLGAFASFLALLLPARTKTFGLAIYMSIIVLIYSTAPQIIGLALSNYDIESAADIQRTKVILAVLIPVGYVVAGIGFLFCIRLVHMDVAGDIVAPGGMSFRRKMAFGVFATVLGALVVALFVTSLVIR